MTKKFRLTAFVAALALLSAGVPYAEEQSEIVSTAKEQTSLSLTVYNNDLALIRDKRRVNLPDGTGNLAFREVSARIRPESALLSGDLRILEQNFEYDLLTPASLLRKYVGREVTLIERNPSTGEDFPPQPAKVLSANGKDVVFKVDGRIETGLVNGRLVYPDVPENLRDRPTLLMQVHCEKAGPRDVELSYLSHGLTWQADYVAELNAEENELDLNGWVTLDNKSGASYKNAQLQLVAGKINVVREKSAILKELQYREDMAANAPQGAGMAEEQMFEYHLYTLERPTSVLENQTKQLALLEAGGVKVQKQLILHGAEHYYRHQAGDLGEHLDVDVELEIKNTKEHGLGLPIPAGTMRVYKKDSKGFLQFVGEDQIDHTPEGETMRLHMGSSFDVSAAKKQSNFKKFASSGPFHYQYASSYEITLKNAREEKARVKVLEPLPGDWTITAESAQHTKESAHTASWMIEVPAKGETKLSYTANVKL